MEVYIDDRLVKFKSSDLYVHHLNDTFQTCRKCNMKLDPTKYNFGVKAWKFMGYLIIQLEIEVNLDQLKSVLNIATLRNKREVQRLTGRLAALTEFISKALERF